MANPEWDNYRTYICSRCEEKILGERITLHHLDWTEELFHLKCMEKIEQKERKILRKRGEVHVLTNQGD